MTNAELEALGASLTEVEREALRPCATERRCLLKKGLAHWGQRRPLHRFPSLKLTSKGYAVRNRLGLTEPTRS